MLKNIISEMYNGNFSFAILAVGILQLIVMIRKKRTECFVMSEQNRSIISQCEKIANEFTEKFIQAVDMKTSSFAEYRFVYRLALDTLVRSLEQYAPK